MKEIKVPVFPESITDAVVVEINKNVGDEVMTGDTVFSLETDKVVLDVVSEESGVITKISVKNGDTVIESQLLAELEIKDISVNKKEAAVAEDNKTPQTSPAVRQALIDNDLSKEEVAGSGKNNRILKEDVTSHKSSTTTPVEDTPMRAGERLEERVPMSRMRQTIAKRLLDATNQSAMLTTFNEVDMTSIMSMRKKHQEKFVSEHGVKLGFMSLFVKAATNALKKFPAVNSFIDGDDIVYHGYCDISVAVSTDRGLVVPVLKDTQELSLADVENKIIDFSTRAKSGKLELSEISGGTFTITNGGTFGSLMSTPIINPPQSAVLGMHNIQKRAVVIDNEIVIRDMMYVALSYDHRIIDGKDAVMFLSHIKDTIEDPTRIVLDL
ncbi:2-oxoglutarate dehydrogenase complex dihydrolipoyllysine-residue succinyltransferase [Candidatus Thioglobus sp.]|jgi:2-oxoglutarate dehydrogenase E2 component (dihydrolipoamide succinyltransferase)|uniref:2-oxoglutarate dehydrogenase complex dihydrolipoyllysine-residue succinyltransferase n=1 Tax=Candidatus Thioglobus sp. TaxID=2026721 RepID=UPI0025C2FD1A|nr:2-oxoglutarate dehydrogenase complex dihydrolipoyllysine-residue succinyltransferase [Candidatus Thioglobus sp.]MBT3276933.1 2-oxoglutarate dehydrogenase complex dihydrolipoyllysine-residue succinyltransferase [Candidatus Thioglobus sp.]